MSKPYSCLKIEEIEEGIVQMTLDMPGRGANILDQVLFDELDRSMEEICRRDDLDGLILFSAKRSIFIAGADLTQIADSLDWPEEKIVEFCERGRAVMARFSRAPFVTVAAIHGACVGGGLELALWCDYRVASADRRTQLGLPEVKLGLVPGWAGTARLPRLIGFEPAAELIISGRSVDASRAHELGFVDAVASEQDLITTAIELARKSKTSESFIAERRAIMGPVANLNRETELETRLAESVERLAKQIAHQRDIFPFAPTVVLEHLSRTAPLPQTEAWKSESLAMAQVWGSPANRGLLNNFFLVDHNKKNPGLVDTTLATDKITTVGIVGAGVMGKAIAENCLKRGVAVLIHDAADGLAQQVADELQPLVSGASTTCFVRAIDHFAEFAAADLIIESVVENPDIKRQVLQKIESAVSPQTIMASNTSAIQITRLAQALQHPERFCGIHFCHPLLMALVEVVCGERTSEMTIASAVAFVRQVGKMPIAIHDGPGFVVNRLLAAMLNQAIDLLIQGIPAESIDRAMRDFGFLGGPFEMIDTIGVDTCMYAGRVMWDDGVTCISPSPLLPKLVKLRRLGRKSGVGVYRYDSPQDRGVVDPEFANIVRQYQNPAAVAIEPSTNDDAIVSVILRSMVDEAQKILEQEIVNDTRDIDLCVIYGLGFPQHQGGLLYWDQSQEEVG